MLLKAFSVSTEMTTGVDSGCSCVSYAARLWLGEQQWLAGSWGLSLVCADSVFHDVDSPFTLSYLVHSLDHTSWAASAWSVQI